MVKQVFPPKNKKHSPCYTNISQRFTLNLFHFRSLDPNDSQESKTPWVENLSSRQYNPIIALVSWQRMRQNCLCHPPTCLTITLGTVGHTKHQELPSLSSACLQVRREDTYVTAHTINYNTTQLCAKTMDVIQAGD